MNSNLIDNKSRPRLFAYLNTGVNNVTGNGATYTVLLDTIGFGSGYDTGTGLYTAPLTGNYFIASSITLNNLISGANGNQCNIVTNSISYRIFDVGLVPARSVNSIFITAGSINYNLTAGQTVSLIAKVNNATSDLVGISGGSSPYLTWLYICYLP
jgi:hypothetical protein